MTGEESAIKVEVRDEKQVKTRETEIEEKGVEGEEEETKNQKTLTDFF